MYFLSFLDSGKMLIFQVLPEYRSSAALVICALDQSDNLENESVSLLCQASIDILHFHPLSVKDSDRAHVLQFPPHLHFHDRSRKLWFLVRGYFHQNQNLRLRVYFDHCHLL